MTDITRLKRQGHGLLCRAALAVGAALAFLLPAGCADGLEDNMPPAPAQQGLVLKIDVDGQEARTRAATTTSDSKLREALIDHLDVFFWDTDGNVAYYEQVQAEAMAEGSVQLCKEVSWRDVLPAAQYDVTVLANVHTYNDPDAPGETKTDFAWVASKTTGAKAYIMDQAMDTDADAPRAEGEIYKEKEGEEEKTYTGKLFLMDAELPGWQTGSDDDATLNVTLRRAAAKIVVNVSYDEKFFTSAVGEHGGRTASTTGQQLWKTLVHYHDQAMLTAGRNASGASAVYGEAKGKAVIAGNPYASKANIDNNGEDKERKQTLVLYTYPTGEWTGEAQETYVLVNIPYTVTPKEGEPAVYDNYYKVPVRLPGSEKKKSLERNKLYMIDVLIDRVGSPEVAAPVTIEAACAVAEWKDFDITIDDTRPTYLEYSITSTTMDGEETRDFTVMSSSPVTVTLEEVSYRIPGKNPVLVVENGKPNYTITDLAGNDDPFRIQVMEEQRVYRVFLKKNLASLDTDYYPDLNKNYGAMNRLARHVKVKITNATDKLEKTLELRQYPNEMLTIIHPVLGMTNTDKNVKHWNYHYFQNMNTESAPPQKSGDISLITSNAPLCSVTPTFQVYEIGRLGSYGAYYLSPKQVFNGGSVYANTFIVRTASNKITLGDVTYNVGRPTMTGTGEEATVVDGDEGNMDLISPAFAVASNLGRTTPVLWREAKTRCAEYIEVWDKDYNHKNTVEFNRWRLPTKAELQLLYYTQKNYPNIVSGALTFDKYWGCRANWWISENAVGEDKLDNHYVRCVYDLSEDDLKKLEELDAF